MPVTLSLRGSPDELVSQGLSQVPRCLFRLAAPGHRNEMLEKMMQGGVAGLAGTTALNAATYADMAMRGAVLLWQHGATFTGLPGRTGGRNPARGVRTAGGVTGGASR